MLLRPQKMHLTMQVHQQPPAAPPPPCREPPTVGAVHFHAIEASLLGIAGRLPARRGAAQGLRHAMLHMCSTLLPCRVRSSQARTAIRRPPPQQCTGLPAMNSEPAACFLRRPPAQPACELQHHCRLPPHLTLAAMPGIARPRSYITQDLDYGAAAASLQPHLKSAMMPGISSLLSARGVG